MGVQILNKDVSLISSIANVAKAQISNIGGIGGWAGGGDVTPNPTPVWNDVAQFGGEATTDIVQITGIDTTITFNVVVSNNGSGTLTAAVNSTNTYGGTVYTYTGPNSSPPGPGNFSFSVPPNYYVSFRVTDCDYTYIEIFNQSDNNTFLDDITFFRP